MIQPPSSLKILLVVLISNVLLFGCSVNRPAKTNSYSSTWKPYTASQKTYVAPIVRTYSFDRSAMDIVEREFRKALTQTAHAVEFAMSQQDLVSPELVTTGTRRGPRRQIAYYRSGISKNPGFSLYVFPEIVARKAILKGKLAKWDGVKQTFRMVGGSGIGEWTGERLVYSLQLEVFDSAGDWLFTSYGGISLPVYAFMASREVRRKDNLFENRDDFAALVVGIEKAIQPLVIKESR